MPFGHPDAKKGNSYTIKLLSYLGTIYSRLFLYELAINVLKQSSELGWVEENIYSTLAYSYFGLNKMDEAVKICKEGLSVNPSWDVLRFGLGSFYLHLNNTQEAINIAEELKAKNDPRAYGLAKMIEIEEDRTPEKEKMDELKFKQQAKEYMQECEDQMSKGELKTTDAVKILTSALQSYDQLAPAYTSLGKILDDYGLIDEGLSLHKRAIELDPSLCLAYNNLGYALQVKGKLNEAIDAYNKALELDPKSVQTHNCLGVLYDYLEDYEKGLAHFQEALKIDPHRINTLRNLAYVYAVLGKVEEALSIYKKYAQLYPKDVQPRIGMGNIYYEMGLYSDAEREFKKALKIEPNNLHCWLRLIECYKAMGKENKAEEIIPKIIDIAPTSPYELFEMARIVEYLNKDRAIYYWNKYLSISERYPLDPKDVEYAKNQLTMLIGKTN